MTFLNRVSAYFNKNPDKLKKYQKINELFKQVSENEDVKFDLLVPYFKKIVESGEVKSWLKSVNEEVANGDGYEPPGQSNEFEWILLITNKFSLTLRKTGTERPILVQQTEKSTIVGMANDCIAGNVGGGELKVDFFTNHPDHNQDVFNPDHVLTLAKSHILKEGESIYARSGKEVIKIHEYSKSLLVLEMVAIDARSLVWHYDPTTLKPKKAISASMDSSRLLFGLDILSDYLYNPAKDNIRSLIKHKDHFVRWKSLQTIGKLDQELAKQILFEMRHDPHPSIRSTVNQILANER